MDKSKHALNEVHCTTEDLIKAVPDWIQIGGLVSVDPYDIGEHFNVPLDRSEFKVMGLIIEYYVLDIDSIEDLTTEELEELFHYGEWFWCTLLVKGAIIETDISSINKI
jgi:hypothetical protein